MEADDQGRLGYFAKSFFLVGDVGHGVGFFDEGSVEHFDGVEFFCFVVVAEVDFCEIALSEFANDVEIADLHFLLTGLAVCGGGLELDCVVVV